MSNLIAFDCMQTSETHYKTCSVWYSKQKKKIWAKKCNLRPAMRTWAIFPHFLIHLTPPSSPQRTLAPPTVWQPLVYESMFTGSTAAYERTQTEMCLAFDILTVNLNLFNKTALCPADKCFLHFNRHESHLMTWCWQKESCFVLVGDSFVHLSHFNNSRRWRRNIVCTTIRGWRILSFGWEYSINKMQHSNKI